jgi:heme-degrading monooxygenase HmoA
MARRWRDQLTGECPMIIREWRGRADRSKADAYPAHFRNNVLPELRGIAGFLGAQLSQRHLTGNIEFLVLTRWQSLDANRAFAESDIAKAIVEPGGAAALLEFDATVQHYEVIEEVESSGA